MSAARKGFYYKRLAAAGVPFERHFREYTVDELIAAHELAEQQGLVAAPTAEELAELEERAHRAKARKADTEARNREAKAEETQRTALPQASTTEPPPPSDWFTNAPQSPGAQDSSVQARPPESVPTTPAPPVSDRPDPNEMAGQRQNTNANLEEVIRIDDQGRHWLQEEVRKPAYPKPRGRRVLRYNDPGVRKETQVSGEYSETFEVAGDPRNATPAEVKITLPSFQVGIYRDRRFPFKVVTYGGIQGFDREDVIAFYGGAELVPTEVKRMYVENVLCYDMRSVIAAIRAEHRQQQLTGQIR